MDLRYSFCQPAKNPAFALIAIFTLALGIGANTAIFSFVNSWIIRPLPFPDPNRVVVLFETDKKSGSPGPVAPADWNDWLEKSGIFEDLATATGGTFNLTATTSRSESRAIVFRRISSIRLESGRRWGESFWKVSATS